VPVILQKILQTMENPKAPKSAALSYAVITFVLRLLNAQYNVFQLWYQRRCYERSRGEMITMLYEKTLSRKVLSISSKARTEDGSASLPAQNGSRKTDNRAGWKKALNFLVYPILTCCGRSKAKTTEKDELATMGKILNLMRYELSNVGKKLVPD
jgi:hypothetical protein